MTTSFKDTYFKQLMLLLKILPLVAQKECFCLKGGTAINLFVTDMPRLSVDIDLTYIRLNDRDTAINEIEQTLLDIKHDLIIDFPGLKIYEKRTVKDKRLNKLYIEDSDVQIVIEPNTILRGTLYPIDIRHLTKTAEELMQLTVSNVPVLNRAELYAGKICASLDRQHPRDLFDIKLLYENGGITDAIRQAFVVYVACNSRPIHELLNPNLLDVSKLYANEFVGMSLKPVEYSDLLSARVQLIRDIKDSLLDTERKFLLSVKKGKPEWELLPFENLEHLPALKWKMINIAKLERNKHKIMVDKLRAILKI
jgi:predicted nucleotidyltransferase component of viral defense system